MPDFTDFLRKEDWTPADLAEFLRARFREGDRLEYKEAQWILSRVPPLSFDGEGKKNLRRWVTAFANAGGGLLVIGVTADPKDKGLPGQADPVPRSVWGSGGARTRLLDALANKVHPRLFPAPLVHVIPHGENADVIILDVPEVSMFPYHRVLDEEGSVPIRDGDSVRNAAPWLISALEGRRGLNRPVLTLTRIPGKSRSENGVLAEGFRISNHGTTSIHNLQIGLVMSKTRVKKPWFNVLASSPDGSATLYPETRFGSLPDPLRSVFRCKESTAMIGVAQRPLLPMQDFDIEAGYEARVDIGGRWVVWGIWVMGENIPRPEVKAFHGGRSTYGSRFEEVIGPSFDLDAGDPDDIRAEEIMRGK